MNRTLVCAIQIGTSRICAAAAWRDQNGNYEIAALDSEASNGCVRRGCIVDVEQAAAHIKSLVGKLSNRVKFSDCLGIEAAYVGIDGFSLHSRLHEPSVELEDGKAIDHEVIAALRKQSLYRYSPDFDIITVETKGYTLDDVECINPDGRTGSTLTAHHLQIMAQQRLRNNVRLAMEKAGVRLAGILITPLCVAQILTPEEKQRGCVLVDIGHSLTSVSVYWNGTLQHLATIPLGGNSVTMDLMSKGISPEEAETTKTKQEEMDIVSRCRYEEIAANIYNQIELSGCKEQLESGCVLTGGASLQRGLVSLFGERLGIKRIMARGYSDIVYGISDRKPQLAGLTSMISFCTTDCSKNLDGDRSRSKAKGPDLQGQIDWDSPEPPKTEVEENVEETKEVSGTLEVVAEQEPAAAAPKKNSGFSRFFKDLISGIDE